MTSPLPREIKSIVIDYLDDFRERYDKVVHSVRAHFHGDVPFTVSEHFFPSHCRSDALLASLSRDVSLKKFQQVFLVAWEWFFTDSLYYEDRLSDFIGNMII